MRTDRVVVAVTLRARSGTAEPPKAAEPIGLAPETTEAINRAKAALDREVRRAEMTEDPAQHHFAALAATVDALHKLIADATLAVGRQVDTTRQSIGPEVIDQLSRAASNGAGRYMMSVARAQNRKTLAILATVGAGLFVVGAGGGYFLGHREGVRSAPPYSAMASADEANGWAQLIQSNRTAVVEALRTCDTSAQVSNGRRACAVPLWLDPPSPPVAAR